MRRFMAVLCLCLAGCGTLPNGRGLGEDASLEPSNRRLAWAADRALRDPGTWIPAAAALAVAASGNDRRLSDWAREERPVFSDSDHAGEISDNLRDTTDVGMFATALATPSGPEDEFVENKGRVLAVESLAILTTIGATNVLKETVRRPQPRGDGHESFTSNHATQPFAHAALIRRNTDHLDLPPAAEFAIDGAFTVMAAGSAWARVEMGLHYPSDQLAGAAIGNFIAMFFYDAFLLDDRTHVAPRVAPAPGVAFHMRW